MFDSLRRTWHHAAASAYPASAAQPSVSAAAAALIQQQRPRTTTHKPSRLHTNTSVDLSYLGREFINNDVFLPDSFKCPFSQEIMSSPHKILMETLTQDNQRIVQYEYGMQFLASRKIVNVSSENFPLQDDLQKQIAYFLEHQANIILFAKQAIETFLAVNAAGTHNFENIAEAFMALRRQLRQIETLDMPFILAICKEMPALNKYTLAGTVIEQPPAEANPQLPPIKKIIDAIFSVIRIIADRLDDRTVSSDFNSFIELFDGRGINRGNQQLRDFRTTGEALELKKALTQAFAKALNQNSDALIEAVTEHHNSIQVSQQRSLQR